MGGYSGNFHEPQTPIRVFRYFDRHERTVFACHFPCITGRSGRPQIHAVASVSDRRNPQAFPSDPDRSQQNPSKDDGPYPADCRGFPGDFRFSAGGQGTGNRRGRQSSRTDDGGQTTERQRFFSVIRHPSSVIRKPPNSRISIFTRWKRLPGLQSQRQKILALKPACWKSSAT